MTTENLYTQVFAKIATLNELSGNPKAWDFDTWGAAHKDPPVGTYRAMQRPDYMPGTVTIDLKGVFPVYPWRTIGTFTCPEALRVLDTLIAIRRIEKS